jgi:hypothetical protein
MKPGDIVDIGTGEIITMTVAQQRANERKATYDEAAAEALAAAHTAIDTATATAKETQQ